jgi:deoxyribodipyrimidine photo-lyase
MPLADAALVWYRRDLRLTDHAALSQALATARRVHGVFVFDTDILDALPDRQDRRVAFIWSSVAELKAELERHGGSLHVLHGPARTLVPALADELGVGQVHAARDYEPYARTRDQAVADALARRGKCLTLHKDQVVFDTDEVLTAAGQPFHVYTPYRRAWLARLSPEHVAEYPTAGRCDRLARTSPLPMPRLADLGFEPIDLGALGIRCGETGARALLADFLQRIDRYHERRDFPRSLSDLSDRSEPSGRARTVLHDFEAHSGTMQREIGEKWTALPTGAVDQPQVRQAPSIDGPSYLSVHLRFGTVSVRELVRQAIARQSEGARVWLSELIWREFYQMLLWHYPETVEHAFQRKFDRIPWPNPPGHYEAWCEARTGYPIVDAAMRQLNRTGYMHNRLRMIAASFLVKDLHVDWRRGERYFADKLIDYDLAANVGGWQWCAGVGTDAQPWFRIFNPVTQSQRFDPGGRFIRRYLPELAPVPDRYLHAPWQMPQRVQAACGVAIGRDYPPPIVDHAQARQATLALFRGVS